MTATRLPVLDRRRAGVLLHLGLAAARRSARGGRAFIDWLAQAGFSVWQILPLGPDGRRRLAVLGALRFAPATPRCSIATELPPAATPVRCVRRGAAQRLARRLRAVRSAERRARRRAVVDVARAAARSRARRDGARAQRARAGARAHARRAVRVRRGSGSALREYAHARGVRLFGDLPFYVAPDSAETWANRKQFQLDARRAARRPWPACRRITSRRTGQLWGNPLYDWDAHARAMASRSGARACGASSSACDLLRIDHFRALAAHWAVPAGAPDARGGRGSPTPGRALLQRCAAISPTCRSSRKIWA